jgi:Tfp pilus assembly protein PilX
MKPMIKQDKSLVSNQSGMVAIVTTMILMIVISLIVLGFSQIVRRNTRQVTDAQLSSQAFYAAESGLNLAKREIIDQNSGYKDKSNCKHPGSGPDYTINDQTEITCLLTHDPDHLRFDGVNSDASRVSLIKSEDGAGLDEVTITWQNNSPTAGNVQNCSGAGKNLPTASPDNWSCNQPILRVDLIPVKDINNKRSDLIANQFTAFLYPSNSGTSTDWIGSTGSNKGNIVLTKCDDSSTGINLKCRMTITGMDQNQYAVRILSLYEVSDVIIYAKNRPTLIGGQVIVDSTARSLDVIKRIRARVPLTDNDGTVPDFAIDTGSDICKRYKVQADSASTESPADGCLP